MNALVVCDPVADAESLPLDQIDVSDPRLYQNHIWQPYFTRLRREQDIVDVETRHQEFSSEAALGGFMITERPAEYRRPSFIAVDPPKHTSQRRVVAPTFAPTNMQAMAAGIRERVPAPFLEWEVEQGGKHLRRDLNRDQIDPIEHFVARQTIKDAANLKMEL